MSAAAATDHDVPRAYCAGCGRAVSLCAGCAPALDPPRYCAQCGRWLAVSVTPSGWRARCTDHGDTHSA